jgi:CTP synthase
LKKIALFGNLPNTHVISLPDSNSIYKVPLQLSSTSLKSCLEQFLGRDLKPRVPEFYHDLESVEKNGLTINIGLISKYNRLGDSYLSVIESLKIAAANQGYNVRVSLIDSDSLNIEDQIDGMDGIIVPGGFGRRGMEGKIRAIQYIRQNRILFLGICLGLQMAVVEYAQNVAGLDKAVSSEMFDERDQIEYLQPVIDFIPGQENIHKKGGTMRLGGYDCRLEEGSLAASLYHEPIFGSVTATVWKSKVNIFRGWKRPD